MSEGVPEGWSPALFGDLAKVINGYAFQSSDFVEKSETSVPIIRMSSLKAGVIDLTDAVHVAAEKTKGLEKFLLGEGDFVFGMSGSISNFAIIKEQDGVCYQNQRVGRLSPTNASSEFVSQLFLSESVTRQIEGLAAGGAQLNVSSSQIENLNILNPPLPEQKKISAILTSVDEVIEITQKQIDKLQDLKKATMNELLTKGIGHTEFKNSELGQIPKSWLSATVSELISKKYILAMKDGNHGAQYPRTSEFQSHGVPFLAASSISKTGDFFIEQLPHLSVDRAAQLRIPCAIGGDVILTHNATVGRVSIIPGNIGEIILSTSTTFYRTKRDLLLNIYLKNFMESDLFQSQLARVMGQTTRNQVPITAQRDLLILVPSNFSEQREISKSIASIQETLGHLSAKLTQTQSLKKSLMQDLLTGKVRVKVD